MMATHIMDTIMASLGHIVILHTIYKFLRPRKSAKYMQFVFPIIFSFYYYALSYSETLNTLIPNVSVRQILMPISIFLCIAIYIAAFFKSDIKYKLIAFIGSVFAIAGAEITMIFMLLPFGIRPEISRHMPFNAKLLMDFTILLLYTAYSIAAYFIFKNYKSHFPWKITLNICFIISSCVLLFLLIINVTSTNFEYLRIAIIVAFLSIAILILSVISIANYINTQQLETEQLYWKQQLHDLNLKYSQTYDEKTNEIKQIQHDFKDSLDLIRFLIDENTQESKIKASKLINDLSQKIDNAKIDYYTNCVTINAILTNKITQAQKDNITINPVIDIPESVRINHNVKELDIDVILINLLNNAIESCKNLPDNTDKVIDIKVAVKGNFLFIKTVNPYSSLVFDKNKKILTSKDDNEHHGLGIDIIKTIVDSYGGTQTIKTDNNVFTHIISLDLYSNHNEYE